MKKLLFLAILFSPFAAGAQSVDTYGGRNDLACTNSSGYYRLALLANGRHWLCTPSSHGQFAVWLDLMTPGSFFNAGATNHYSGYAGQNNYPQYFGAALHDLAFSWNFNGAGFFQSEQFAGAGQLAPGEAGPTGQMPWLYSWEFGRYALENNCSILSEPIKDPVSNHSVGGHSGFFVDVYDPNWPTYLSGILTHRGDAGCNNIASWPSSFTTNPWLVVESFGESDTWTGQGSPTIHPWTVWLILQSEMTITGGDSGPYGPKQIFARTTNYTKQQLINSLTTEYGSIGALNTAWGSTYTQFATTGTSVSAEAFGTGDGSTLTFNHTLAHTPVDDSSVAVLVGGTLQLGDDANGNLVSAGGTIGSGTVTYSTGVVAITFAAGHAPGNGVAITANYNYNGYCHGTGLADECGNGSWMGDGLTLAGETASMQTDVRNLMTTLWGKAYQTQHDAIRAFDPNHMITAFLSPTSDARTQVLLPATNACSGGPCIDVWLAPTQSGISNTSSVTLQPLSRIYDLTGIPILTQSPYLMAETDSALSGTDSNGPDCVKATTQALRGMNYFTYVSNALALKANDGTYPIVGTEYWGLMDNTSAFCNLNQNENLGIMTDTANTYNGVEPASGAVSCSAPLGTQTCGSEPAPGGSGVRPFGNYIGNASAELMGVKAGNGLWLGTPTTKTAPSFGSFP